MYYPTFSEFMIVLFSFLMGVIMTGFLVMYAEWMERRRMVIGPPPPEIEQTVEEACVIGYGMTSRGFAEFLRGHLLRAGIPCKANPVDDLHVVLKVEQMTMWLSSYDGEWDKAL